MNAPRAAVTRAALFAPDADAPGCGRGPGTRRTSWQLPELPVPTREQGDHRRAGRAAAGGRRCRLRQDRDYGRPGGLAGRQRVRAPRADPRPDLHPQGRRRAGAPVRIRLDQLIRRRAGHCRGMRDDTWPASRPSPPTTRTPGGSSPSTGCAPGYEPSTRLLTEASRWQLVDLLVRSYDGDMSEVDRMRQATVTDAVLASPGELDEHLVDRNELAAWTGRFFAEVRPPRPGATPTCRKARTQRNRLRLLPLVRAYARRKDDFEAMDFADQLARAARVARDHPSVAVIERDRFQVVLLDEYQDTSHAQVVLLNALFGGGHPVTAVGDPCQSIYGWRGASAGTLDRFPGRVRPRRRRAGAECSASPAAGEPRRRSSASPTRCRCRCGRPAPGCRELHAALSVRDPIPHRSARGRAAGTVHCALLPTYADEADWIADSVLAAWRGAAGMPGALPEHPGARRPTTAVLVRLRSQIPAIETGAAGPGPAGRGGRAGRPAGHTRGSGRGLHLAGARRSRPTGRRCCGCSPGRAGGSGRATWSPCTGGPEAIARHAVGKPAGGASRAWAGDRGAGGRARRRRSWSRRWPTRGRRRAVVFGGGSAPAASCGMELALLRAGWTSPCRSWWRTSSGPSGWTWRWRSGHGGTAPATPAWPGPTWTRSVTWRPGSAARRRRAPCRLSSPTWPPPRTRSAG